MAPAARLILGVDPGLASTGYGLVEGGVRVVDCGTIRTGPAAAGVRLLAIADAIDALLARHSVDEAALEELFLGRNRTSAIGVAEARGAVLMTLARAKVTAYEYKPSQVKALLTGYGAAGKQQMAKMLQAQVRGARPDMDDHAVDAVAIALCHARTRAVRLAAPAAS
ncbi:MAG: crossover junction endodeoxyribonuclease RuvC [Candidatus Dormibacterales bacterium]